MAVLATLMGVTKEGPSAGLAIVPGLVSALTGRRVRNDIAITGETTIMGKVLPVGGIHQKLRAASDAGAKEVLIPEENVAEANGLPLSIRQGLRITPVNSIQDALQVALLNSAPGQE